MEFRCTSLTGVYVIEPQPYVDERGLFARTFSEDEFRQHRLDSRIAQCSVSFNPLRGTLRGLHYQAAPAAEARLVRCTRGAIYDVVVDLRPDSPTHLAWVAAELSADNRRMVYVPVGCAHGFLTLSDAAELFYQMSEPYQPGLAAGVRWNDPAFRVEWPFEPTILSKRDATYPDFVPASTGR